MTYYIVFMEKGKPFLRYSFLVTADSADVVEAFFSDMDISDIHEATEKEKALEWSVKKPHLYLQDSNVATKKFRFIR